MSEHCVACGLSWSGPYTDCPGCEAQAGMKGVSDLGVQLRAAEQQIATLTEALADMKRASGFVDAADGPAEYQTRLIALALIARKFLRKAALAAVRGETR